MKIAEFPLKRISQQQRYAHQSIFLIFLVVLAIFLSAPLPTQAQTSSNASWRTFTTADGLASNTVQAIYQDNEGSLWFGTPDNGVSRYQGGRWQTFTIADGLAYNDVRTIYQDSEGALWFGSWFYGVSRYQDGQWQIFSTANGLASNIVQVIIEDREGALWFGTWDAGVSRYQDGQWQTFNTADGLADYSIWAIYQDKDGALWFGTRKGGVSRYQDGQWRTFTIADGLSTNFVQAIYQDNEGALWFGTEDGGVSRYQDGHWQTFTTADGLADNTVVAIAQDSEGALWFGTRGRGVSRYQRGQWQTFTTADGLAGDLVLAIIQDDEGAMWFGTAYGDGVSRYQGEQWQSFTNTSSPVDKDVWAIYQDQEGALWFGTRGRGVSRYQGGQWQSFTTNDGLINNNVWAITQDNKGGMWFGTEGGVSRYQGGQWQRFIIADNLVDNRVSAIRQDREGVFWFGLVSGEVSRYHDEQWQTFTLVEGLADNSVQAIYQDDEGALWFGTWGGGGSRYKNGQWQTFTTTNNLIDDNVWAITQDNKGAMWFGTDGGVSHYQGGQWLNFTINDGLVDNAVWAITQDNKGVLWFGTKGGISRYLPGNMPPGVWLTAVNGQSYQKEGSLNLSPDTDHLTVEFEGGDAATRTEDLVYEHRLVGMSEAWTPTNRQFAVYRNLSPGHYTFQVKALDRDGNFSKTAEVDIVIPTSRSTLYGYGLAGLTTLAIATVGFNRWQKQRRTGQAIAHKENPYSANVPVKDPKMFFGREDILRQIVNGIHLNNFAVCGPKRIGKTSLLHQVAVALPKLEDAPNSLRPVMLSLHGVAEGYFFYHLARAIAQQTRAGLASPSLPGRADEGAFDEYQFLEELETTHAALQAASTKPLRLVLLIDEGDALNAYSQPTLAKLRYVLMGPGLELLKMVWSGEGLDQRPWALPGSDWLTVFGDVFYLTPLTEAEATRLIQDPVPYYDYDKEAIRLILEQSQLIPHRIQLLCRTAIEEMLKEGRGRIEVKDVEAAGHALTSLPYRVAAVTEAQGQLAESRSEYHTRPGDEATE